MPHTPHEASARAVRNNRPVQAQYVRQGRRGARIMAVLVGGLLLTAVGFALVWAFWAGPFAAARLIREEPELMRSLWLETLVDGAISREWVLSLGVQNAKERFARFFCELFMRMEIVGLTEGDGFRLTMTQTEMSDMLGMSAVHVNRIIGELREEGLIEMSGGRVRLPDLEALAALGEFESAYLEAPADLLRAIA